jgi:FkbM family methyltransferase
MLEGLSKLYRLNLGVRTIVDVGAAAGTWTLLAKRFWAESFYLLFEPLAERQSELAKLALQHASLFIAPFAAGNSDGEASFYVAGDLDGSGVATAANNPGESIRIVGQTTVDKQIASHGLKGPFLVKLDTHGYELPIIEGCKAILPETIAFIIECYGFRIAEKSLLFPEMCVYMDRLGYRVFDIVDVVNRPSDGAFWQCDAFFIRKDNPVFHTSIYN